MPSITLKPQKSHPSGESPSKATSSHDTSKNAGTGVPKRSHSLSVSLKNLFIKNPKLEDTSKKQDTSSFNEHTVDKEATLLSPEAPAPVVTTNAISSESSQSGFLTGGTRSPPLRSKKPALPTFAEEGSENSFDNNISTISKPSDVYLPHSQGRGREQEQLSHPRSRSQSRAKVTSPNSNVPNSLVGSIRIFENGNHEHVLKARKVLEKMPNSTGILSGFLKKSSSNIQQDVAFSLLPEQNRMDFQRRLSIQSSKLEEDTDESSGESDDGADNDNENDTDEEGLSSSASAAAAIGDPQLKLINRLIEQINNDEEPSITNRNYKLTDKYGKPQGIIGKGAYGVVKLVSKTDSATKKEIFYAVKELKKKEKEDSSHFSTRLTSEFVISNALSHMNIVKTIDLMKNSSGAYSEIMEYCSAGDLYTLILATNGEGLHYLEADCFMKQIMRGLSYMHSKGVAHCDIKPENILLTTSGVAKISDFGTSAVFRTAWEKDCHFSSGACGSEHYVAPEEFIVKEYDPRYVDVWSAGVVYLTMSTGGYVWEVAKSKDDLFQEYLDSRPRDGKTGTFEPIQNIKSGPYHKSRRTTLYGMLDPNPCTRLTSHEALKTAWMQNTMLCEVAQSDYHF